MTDDRLHQIEQELENIKHRNQRVESNKAWETSAFRIGTICIITYLTAAAVLYVIGIKEYYYAAIVPAIGFWLSTQSLPVIKKWWIKKKKLNK